MDKAEETRSLVFLLTKALIPSCGPTLMTSSKLNHLPEAPFLNVITLESRASIYEFGPAGREAWGTVQSQAPTKHDRPKGSDLSTLLSTFCLPSAVI